MQKTPSNPSCTRKPLPKTDPSCFVCASLLGDVESLTGCLAPTDPALTRTTGDAPGGRALTSACPHEGPAAQDSHDPCRIPHFT